MKAGSPNRTFPGLSAETGVNANTTPYNHPMLTTAARARLTVVLVGARNPSNIGAAARALHDFGFSDLRIVNDFAAPFEAAQLETAQIEATQIETAQIDAASPEIKSAVAAHSVMRSARRFNTLAEAIADCTLIVGTTAIGEREIKLPILPLQQAAPLILSALGAPGPASGTREGAAPGAATDNLGAPCLASETWAGTEPKPRVALLFGSEKTGLTNDQLSHCTLLTTIPMFSPSSAPNSASSSAPSAADPDNATRHLSMNLGQSVAVCLYELTRSGFEHSIDIPQANEPAATAADRERLTGLLLDVLHVTGYTRRFPANAAEPLIRQLSQQLGVSHREAMTWMGIFRQVLWRERS